MMTMMMSDFAERTSSGRLFQTRGAAAENGSANNGSQFETTAR